MPDLYDALGVPKDADHAAIRNAYRQQSKRAHPDAGGTSEKFALIKLAHDTLTDEKRRTRYDQTGETENNPVDNERAKLLEMLAAGLDIAMAKLYEQAKPPIHVDMVALTVNALHGMRRQWEKERHEFQKNVDRSRELLGRWSKTTKTGDENVMESIVKHRVKVCEGSVAMLSDRISVANRAIEELKDVAFRFDDVPPPSPAERWANGAQSPFTLKIGNVFIR